ncbi:MULTISPECIES: putative T7SS-secreted protein [unclassified Streptomyces]|uniref:putative T7SS-secreted protein n=1 Tax=unclassified Streptomyces TaxID=2593676 RepID=UPI001BE50747|nr:MULTISPECIES: RHS repeat-associated core domain-containing protein [unclassified Streptomyces]MBT2403456.1 type IV secretion protein Rhs [Streptomyces sp. ISL-21]MBT2612818.1 type IV secretion protein Rhs [Streptomyces sp. ISL-87]
MGWRDYIPDSVEDVAEDAVEGVGDAIEWAGNKTADVAEDIGLDDAGDWIRDKSRSAANRLGADVEELELGQTDDPKKLVYGSVAKIRDQVSHLNDFKASFEQVGNGLKGIGEPEGLKGKSADAFREAVAKEPPRWFEAAEAFGKAADAMGRFAETVEWAQGQAKEALADYEHAQKVSSDARNAYDKQADAYKDAVKAKQDHLPPRPSDDFDDPGKPLTSAAKEKLTSARKQRNEVAETTRTAVCAARDKAPKKPSYSEQLSDGLDYLELAETHFAGGVLKGTAGTLNFARALNPLDFYNISHPAEYRTNLNSTVTGLLTMANDPWGAGKQMLDEFMKDSNEGIGKFIPDLIGSKGLGSAKRLGSAAKHLDDKKPGGSRGDHEQNPDSNGKRCGETVCRRDPVDIATGRMLLPATDIALPGALPLVFRRTFDSARRSGRWFGSTWSSTVDQRLEIDSAGVIFSCDEGSVLAYPHPAPGVPVMPSHGRQWPLDRVPGGYTITDPDTGRVWHFADHSDELALLAQIDDRNGRWVTFEHDEAGAPTAIVHHAGYHLKLTTSAGRVTALHLKGAATDGSDQEILRYGYTDGHLTSVTNSSGRPLSFDCDEHGRITSWTDTNGSRFDYVYDDQDRCTYQSGTNGHLESTFTWDDVDPATGLRMTTLTSGLGHTERYLINDRSQVVAEIDPLGAVTRFEYDRYNRLLSRTDPLGHVSRATFDERGRVTVVERPDGQQARAEYNEIGLPIRAVGTDGNVTRQRFDTNGNRTSVTDPSGATTHFTYDETGIVTSVTDALGNTTTVVPDKAGLPLAITDPLGATTRYERDAFSRAASITDPLGAVTRLEWTVEGKLARRIEADGSEQSWTYDGEGNCVAHVDVLGGVTTFEYTDFDVLTARTGPDGFRYEFSYDTDLHLTQVTNPQGLTWDYVYDPVGRVTSETDFGDRTLTYERDAAGRLVSRTDMLGQTIRYERDELDRVVRKDAAGAVTTFAYDSGDQLAEAVNADATLTRLRDRYGRLKFETVNGGTTAYAYDELGRRTTRTTPTGAVSTWTYDAVGSRTSLTTSGSTITFGYDAVGQEITRRIGETVTLSSRYDHGGRLTTQHVTGAGHSIQRRDYTYRADGNLIGLDDQLMGAKTFDLDAAGRVTAVRAEGWTERYAYDEAGNQTTASWPSTHPGQDAVGPREYTGTTITRAGRMHYEHDALGRVTLRRRTRLSGKPDTWRYEWDAEDRLRTVTTPDGAVWRYAYDALGRRTSKQRLAADGTTVLEQVTFTWDGTTLCEQTTESPDLSHSIVLTWDHKGLQPLTQRERLLDRKTPQEVIDTRFFTIITDLVGAPTELIDESGTLAWHTRTTLWGTTTWASTSRAYTPLRFPGQYFDPETGLHYNHFRHYDPETARYLSHDPLGLTPAPNPAGYVPNPHTWVDPMGLAGCPAFTPGETLGDVDKIEGWVPKSIPKEAMEVLQDVRKEGWGWGGGPGFYGPKWWTEPFENSGKNGGYQLPTHEPSGKPITYNEYGTYPSPDNPKPGGERWVFGSDGSAYYTPTHYQTYIVGESPRWVN